MKKILFFLLTLFVFTACDSKDDDPAAANIVGIWNIDKYQEIEPDGTVNDTDLDVGYIEFESNGDFTFNFEGFPDEGKYVYDEANKKFNLTYNDDPGRVRTYNVVTFTAKDLVIEKKEMSTYPGEEGVWTDRYELKKR
ncbi:hypothetical protein GU926_13730 [Nibribacter ruber]|uniref:Lipocalin-like domain-containing protein n=1 Tax=Nibribacter ruber TaxID=2698458 RepID=A0A6P1P141_9BACT|nr:lipocalin family protein [Nibribacter ruber]QHL88435.1 hypothetical protein GU926_13730 [Nibribacter ruber]